MCPSAHLLCVIVRIVHGWLLFTFVRLTVTDRVCNCLVCMWIFSWFAKFRTDGDACRHDVCICACLFSWTNIDNGRQYFVHTVKWSRMVEQLRPICARSAYSPCRAQAMYVGKSHADGFASLCPSASSEMSHGTTSWRYSSGFTRACSISYEDDLALSYDELFEFL